MKHFEAYEDGAVHALRKHTGSDYAWKCVARGLHTKAAALHHELEHRGHPLPMQACAEIMLTLDEWDDALDDAPPKKMQRQIERIERLKED